MVTGLDNDEDFASKMAIILSNLGRAKDGHDIPSFFAFIFEIFIFMSYFGNLSVEG